MDKLTLLRVRIVWSAFLQSICLFNKDLWGLISNLNTKEMHWLNNLDNTIEIEVQSNSRTFRFLFDHERGILYDIRDFIKSLGLAPLLELKNTLIEEGILQE